MTTIATLIVAAVNATLLTCADGTVCATRAQQLGQCPRAYERRVAVFTQQPFWRELGQNPYGTEHYDTLLTCARRQRVCVEAGEEEFEIRHGSVCGWGESTGWRAQKPTVWVKIRDASNADLGAVYDRDDRRLWTPPTPASHYRTARPVAPEAVVAAALRELRRRGVK